MSNIILTFTGNVCSTPLTEYVRLAKTVFVPIREEFDQHRFSRYYTDGHPIGARLAEVLSALYRREHHAYLDRPELLRYRAGGEIPDRDSKPHIFFKWRCYRRDVAGGSDLAKVFERHEVHPIIIARSRVSEHGLKVFLSEKIYGGRHQQFRAAKMDADEYAAYLEHQAGVRVELRKEDLAEIRRISVSFFERTERLLELVRYLFANASAMRRVTSESIFKPQVDHNALNLFLNRCFGAGSEIPAEATIAERKAGLDIDHCRNPELAFEDPALVSLEKRYASLLQSIPSVI